MSAGGNVSAEVSKRVAGVPVPPLTYGDILARANQVVEVSEVHGESPLKHCFAPNALGRKQNADSESCEIN